MYRELRATAPVCRNDVTNFWALLKYEDIRFVSSNPAMFSSAKGITIPDPALANPVQHGSLIFTDPPRHRQLRKLINSGFTRRRVAILEPKIREIVCGILDGIDPDSTHEFAEEIAAPLPTRIIAELLGARRRLGAIPGLVGRDHRNRRPRNRTRYLRGDRPAAQVLPRADRRSAGASA